jgi:hypothetical protein
MKISQLCGMSRTNAIDDDASISSWHTLGELNLPT